MSTGAAALIIAAAAMEEECTETQGNVAAKAAQITPELDDACKAAADALDAMREALAELNSKLAAL